MDAFPSWPPASALSFAILPPHPTSPLTGASNPVEMNVGAIGLGIILGSEALEGPRFAKSSHISPE